MVAEWLAGAVGCLGGLLCTFVLRPVCTERTLTNTSAGVPPVDNSTADRERFFKFTWLVLDVMPHYLRLYFKVRTALLAVACDPLLLLLQRLWDKKYAQTLPSWCDEATDGAAFLHGVYNNRAAGTLQLTEGEYMAAVSPQLLCALKPRERVRVAGKEYTVVIVQYATDQVHLNHPAEVTGTFDAFTQV